MQGRDETSHRTHRGRPWLAALVLALALGATGALGLPARAQLGSDVLHQYRLEVDGPSGAREAVMITYPRLPGRAQHPTGHHWPLLIALHGLGEAQRGPERGFLGWNVDYQMPRAYEALLWGHLVPSNFMGLVRREHLARVQAWLDADGFEGVAIVTPYTPAIAQPGQVAERARYGDWLAGSLLTQVRAAYPGLSQVKAGTGIDGISLGGRIALEAGFRHADVFGAVGGMQPAVQGDAELLADLVEPAAAQRIRLLTSDGDSFLAATRALSGELRERSIPHDLVVVPGPHDYVFNRGPGSMELLRFGQTALTPEPTPD